MDAQSNSFEKIVCAPATKKKNLPENRRVINFPSEKTKSLPNERRTERRKQLNHNEISFGAVISGAKKKEERIESEAENRAKAIGACYMNIKRRRLNNH